MASPYAFVTLLTSDSYLPGALTLAAALKDVHPSPATSPEVDFHTVCLVTPETVDVSSIKLLRRAFNVVIGVEIIEHDNTRGLTLLGRPDLTAVLTKLHVFRLTQYQKIIFLDADILPTRPLSHLFSLPHEFSAVPDVGWPDIFNSGVMVLTPGEPQFAELMQLSEAQGSWDGGDQGLLNEWRGDNWHRLSFTYNTTPTAVYTYAPAYERFGSKISAIHFIGPNKPWSSIPWRAPGSAEAQSKATQPLQVYDYGTLVDRWYAVYDKHYRSVPVSASVEFAARRYEAAWDQEASVGEDMPAPPPSTTKPSTGLSLGDLRRMAIEGFSGPAYAQSGEGAYIRLPLDGRMDLMRPRKEKQDDPPTLSGSELEDTGAHGYFFDHGVASSTNDAHRQPLSGQSPVIHRSNLPSTAQSSSQSLSAVPYSHYRSTEDSPPGIASLASPGEEHAQGFVQGTPLGYSGGVQSEFTPASSPIPGPRSVGHESSQRRSTPGHQFDVYPPSRSDSPWPEPSSLQKFDSKQGRPTGRPQIGSPRLLRGQLQLADAPSVSWAGRREQENVRGPGVFQESHLYSSDDYDPPEQSQGHRYGQAYDPPPPPPRARPPPPRSTSPPMMSWNPAVEPPPTTIPFANFPAETYYPNVWDHASGSQHHENFFSPPTQSGALFHVPPPTQIPQQLLQERRYADVIGDTPDQTPSPDRTKVRPVFPWEGTPRHAPGRVFPSTESPPPGLFLEPVKTPSRSPSPERPPVSPQRQVTFPPKASPSSFGFMNAWDTIPSIQKYASRLVRSPLGLQPLQPAFDLEESRHRESELFKRWESGDSSVDGDDEETDGELDQHERERELKRRSRSSSGAQRHKKEYRSQGVQTIPIETRHQGVQVSTIVTPSDVDEVAKEQQARSSRSRQNSFLADKGIASSSSSPATSTVGLRATQSSTPRVPGSQSPRTLRSPRGSTANVAATFRGGASKPSTPALRLSEQPLPMSRQVSSDTMSTPSTTGPPLSPSDEIVTPMRKIGGRVWDPARGVDIFKKGSEEVLSRFLRMGSWEEEARR
ncbi:hypothetical protein OF83DRAFT_1169921 [Amylostereum chailletii]|nr:hypothetical protein OF83DRAFT_1169921 [Amylostereum chailletii]